MMQRIRSSMPAITIVMVMSSLSMSRDVDAAEQNALIVFSADQDLEDRRIEPQKTLNGHFPFKVPKSAKAWEERAEELRERILVSNGLQPMPPKTPLNAVIHGKVERDGFTVEKVYFEAVPGFYVTGMIFRPTGKTGPFPGVLCPHGHGGRLQESSLEKVRKQIAQGEERFEESGRFPKLALCAYLARMGCVAFIYDMIGYVDSVQIARELAHTTRIRRENYEDEDPSSWRLYSTQAELRAQSVMGLQTWCSIRALDFLEGLPDVDPTRLGVTGGSGGGTQTILLGAIDSRPVVAFPQGMVSTSMQGGCTCESTCLLRVGTGNVELAALFAPRPQAMTTANDWTKNMMTDGYPELKTVYKMLGVEENVECTPHPEFPHNYNYITRALMGSWFNKHLQLGLEEPIVEEDYELLGKTEKSPMLHVWDEDHPAPKEIGEDFERKLLAELDAQSEKQMRALWPTDSDSLAKYRTVVGGAVETIIGRSITDVGPIERTNIRKLDRGNYWLFADLIDMTDHQEQLPVISLFPAQREWSGRVVLWLTGQGKAGLFTEEGAPRPEILKLLQNGDALVTADLFAQGEFLNDKLPGDRNRAVKSTREFAGDTFTYNDTLFAQRAHDVLSLISWVRNEKRSPEQVILIGTDGIGPVVAAAGAVSGDDVNAVAVESNGFRFEQLSDYLDANFIPGIVKYGDLPALLALNAPKPLLVTGDDMQQSAVTDAAYSSAAGVVDWSPRTAQAPDAIVNWLLGQ